MSTNRNILGAIGLIFCGVAGVHFLGWWGLSVPVALHLIMPWPVQAVRNV